MIATAKRFPGRGDSPVGAHFEIPVITADWETLWNRELLPYRRLIEKNLIPSIMIAHSIYPALDPDCIATVSRKIITGLLREKMGFQGVITTDSMTMGGIATRYGVATACAMALEAGADLVLMKSQGSLVEETIGEIRRFIEEGRISREELDDKIYRILSMKYEYGLFHAKTADFEEPEKVLRDPGIFALSQEAALKSVLVARNLQGYLPLSKEEKVLVIEQADLSRFVNLAYYPGMLYQNCCRYSNLLSYLETDYTYDEEDLRRIDEKIQQYDTIILTSYFTRGRRSNIDKVRHLAAMRGKKVILVTNTPYELTIPEEADTVIVTFATTIRNIEVVAQTIFGEIQPEGEMPVSNHAQARRV